jgi:hypothetical protein
MVILKAFFSWFERDGRLHINSDGFDGEAQLKTDGRIYGRAELFRGR